jgi:hypothetical protein
MLSQDEIIAELIIALNYCYPVIVVIGTITNVISFIIFSRKRFQNTIFSTYFRFLLIIDTIGLAYLALGKFLYFKFNINIRNFDVSLCRLTMLLAYCVPPASAYILVAISVDRWLTITKPAILLIRRKPLFQIIVCISIIMANFIYNGQLFFSYMGPDDYNKNSTKLKCLIPFEKTLQTMDLINSTIIPFLLMIVSTSLTIKSVFDSRKRMRQSRSTNQNNTGNQLRKKDIKFSITSIAFNVIFLILNIPFAIMAQLPANLMPENLDILLIFALFLTYLNHGMVFFVSVSLNYMFIEELRNLFCKHRNLNV